MANIFSFITFLIVVITLSILTVHYFIASLKKAFFLSSGTLRYIKVLYIPVPAAFFLFYDRSIQGSVCISIFSHAIYCYFTFLLIFVFYGLFFELLIFIRRKSFKKRKFMFFMLFLISFYTVIAELFLADNLKIEKISIKSEKISESVRIVQLSDIHLSSIIGVSFATKIKETVNNLKPDIVVVTGDFVDHGIVDSEGVAASMRDIDAPYGKYAIAGNHEFINGFEQSIDFIKWSGFSFLYSESVNIDKNITLAAVTDRAAKRFGYEVIDDLEILNKTDKSRFVIFLKHQPDIEKEATEKFDLMLSGHTHAGQFFPFGIFVRLVFNYCSGTYKFDSGSILHVNRGTGTWGPPVRFGSMPEITLIELIPE